MSEQNKLPRLIKEGLIRLASLGAEEVYFNILEEKAEELKQHYIKTMRERVTNHIQSKCNDINYVGDIEIKVTVDLKGFSDE